MPCALQTRSPAAPAHVAERRDCLRQQRAPYAGRTVEHVQQRGLGRADPTASRDDLAVRDDVDGTTGDLATSGGVHRTTRTLVGMPSAWKKDVLPGSMPVGPAGTMTSIGENAPALAGAATLLLFLVSISPRDHLCALQDLGAHGLEVAVGEDEADVALDVRQESLKGRELGERGTDGAADPAPISASQMRSTYIVFLPMRMTPSPRRD